MAGLRVRTSDSMVIKFVAVAALRASTSSMRSHCDRPFAARVRQFAHLYGSPNTPRYLRREPVFVRRISKLLANVRHGVGRKAAPVVQGGIAGIAIAVEKKLRPHWCDVLWRWRSSAFVHGHAAEVATFRLWDLVVFCFGGKPSMSVIPDS